MARTRWFGGRDDGQTQTRGFWLRGARLSAAMLAQLALIGCASAPPPRVARPAAQVSPQQTAATTPQPAPLSSMGPTSFSSAPPRITEQDGWTLITGCRGYLSHSQGPMAADVVAIEEVEGGIVATFGIGKVQGVSLCQRTSMSCSGQRVVGEVRGVALEQFKAFLPFQEKVGEDCKQGVVFR